MSWYRTSKLGFYAISRYFTSKITKTPIENAIIINQQLNKFLPRFYTFSRYFTSQITKTPIKNEIIINQQQLNKSLPSFYAFSHYFTSKIAKIPIKKEVLINQQLNKFLPRFYTFSRYFTSKITKTPIKNEIIINQQQLNKSLPSFYAFSRYFTSKIAKTPIKKEVLINQQLNKFLPRFYTFSHYFTSKITKAPIKKEIIINQQLNKFLPYKNYFARVPRPLIVNKSLGFRFYGSYRYDHARNIVRRYYNSQGSERWFNKPKIIFIAVIVGTGTWVTSKFGYVETIPYTNRKHLIVLSQKAEKKMGESYFKKMKAETYKGKILPATHPHSVRVTAISRNIIEALQRELKKPNDVLDDMSTGQITNKGKYKREQSAIDHLLGLEWEVMVVNDENVNAFCASGGKIVVFTGLLKHFTTDEEIATVIGHEVAHAVARHAAERITKKLWFVITQLILFQFFEIRDAIAISDLLLELPFSRRMESEADYIGLMLMASAGYDPRVAPKVYEYLGTADPQIPSFLNYLSTHPSGKNRSKALSKAGVMQEALSNYRETKKGLKVDDNFL